MADRKTTLVAVDVIYGDYGNGDERIRKLKKKGYNPKVIQDEVNRLLKDSRKKSIDTLAHEVIDGLWRSGKKREKVLKACKCNYDKIQKRVNEILNPDPKPDPKGYQGKFPSLRLVKSNKQVIEDAIEFAKWIANDNDFHYGEGKAAHKCGCYFCKTQPRSKKTAGIKMWEHSQCCNPFVTSCFAHGGCIPAWLNVCRRGGAYDWNSFPLKDFDRVKGTPKRGDIVLAEGHMALSLGGNSVYEASGGDDNIPYSEKWNKSISKGTWSGYTHIYRYIGKVDVDLIIYHGEVSDRVGDMQAFLNWYGNYGLKVDREFGDSTLKALEDFQTKEMGKAEADGECGARTIAAMKAVRK